MKREIRRQLVHLSGFIFILLAQWAGKTVVLWYWIIALFLAVYAGYLKWQVSLLPRWEKKIRDFILSFERETQKPLLGAFLFFFSSGLTFLLFPVPIASASCTILVFGDALACLFGKKFGFHRIGRKSLEGAAAFFFGGLLSYPFIGLLAIPASFFASVLELLQGFTSNPWLDDNLLIPLLTAIFIYGILNLF
ncbi:MAG: hypothetical protein DRP12_01730 [Candidatus Aenigmatarchaeota archaeon]|nr:MAG: hypothetical protein DRP12_01730 [Candidatus Aenigmarchaeota archaeon]